MSAEELTLHIASNLDRICTWALAGRENRVNQFLENTQEYIDLLEIAPKSSQFEKTFVVFKQRFYRMKNNVILNEEWAEEALTWANILTHRAKLA